MFRISDTSGGASFSGLFQYVAKAATTVRKPCPGSSLPCVHQGLTAGPDNHAGSTRCCFFFSFFFPHHCPATGTATAGR